MEERTLACGKLIPSCRMKLEAQAPPAITAIGVRITPRSVTTPETHPPLRSIPRAAHICTTRPPMASTARAMAGAARLGSAMPSLGENTPPFQGLPLARARSVASAALSMWVVTPCVRAKSRQRAQPAISASSLDR